MVNSIKKVQSFGQSIWYDNIRRAVGNQNLQGKIAIANAKVAYAHFHEIFSGERWKRLADLGAHVQRPLWANTGTKNPSYPDTIYVAH